jgi:hypothetical protein
VSVRSFPDSGITTPTGLSHRRAPAGVEEPRPGTRAPIPSSSPARKESRGGVSPAMVIVSETVDSSREISYASLLPSETGIPV